MDPNQMAELRRWARRLAESGEGEELRAAARAILLLSDEVDVLRRELTARQEVSGPPDDDGPPPPPSPPPAEEAPEQPRVWESFKSAWARWRKPDDETHRELRRRRYEKVVLAVVAAAALAFAGLALAARIGAPRLHPTGPPQNALIGPTALRKLAFAIRPGPRQTRRAHWTLDGADVTGRALVAGDTAVLSGRSLPDGRHRLSVRIGGGFLGRSVRHTWRFTVDTTPPTIRVPPVVNVEWGSQVRVAGRAEPGARLMLRGRPVIVRDGRFSIVLARRPPSPLRLVARDAAGNVAARLVSVELVPRRPPRPLRAVHVTFYAWATPSLRGPILRMIDEGKIDAVELDLKDESGTIGFDAPVSLGRRIGAVKGIYDLDAAVRLLHARGVRVIGRLVCFRDAVLAGAAWKAGHREQVVQSPDGGPYAGYGGFTNFADPVVRRYNIDVAVAAARAGVDEILYDYVRRPDGPLSSMVFPGLKGTPETSIVGFLAETRAALRPYANVFLGASVFGVASTRPREVAQDIPHMAEHVDYIAPMVYPSHWAPGEYGVADPNSQPYEIVARSLEDFEVDVRGTGARIVPWLQDFSLGVDYGRDEVRAQIRAARDMGIDEFLLWDPNVTYTSDALDAAPAQAPAASNANELGLVPVIMHHQLLPDGGGDFDQTPGQFRAELAELWRDGYYPVRAVDLLEGNLDVPEGKTPVVLTFDDSTNNQVSFLPDGRLSPSCSIGILEAFARTHPGFPATATFFVLRQPFTGNGSTSAKTLRWLAAHGYELGDHTRDHIPLGTLEDEAVQREIVLGRRVITDAVPGYAVRTLALPLGSLPKNRKLAMHGSWHGESYAFRTVLLSGAEPAASPFSTKFGDELPRIGTFDGKPIKFALRYWLDTLRRNPGLSYVSDGDPQTISFPASEEPLLAPAYRPRATPY